MADQPVARCNRLEGHDDIGREIICGKPVPGHPLHVEINGSRALDLKLCGEHKQEWLEHNAPWFDRATAAKVALFKLFEDHKGALYTTSEIRDYLRDVLKTRDDLLRNKEEKALVRSLQDKGKLSFAVERLFKDVRMREEELEAQDWEDITPSSVRNYLNTAFDNRDPRLTPADMRMIAGMADTGMPAQPVIDLYARLRREDRERPAEAEETALHT